MGRGRREKYRLLRYGRTLPIRHDDARKIKFKVCANAEWIDDINLKVMVRPVETVGMRTLNFLFRRNNKVTITPTSTPSTYKIVDTLSRSFTEIIKNPLLSKICQKPYKLRLRLRSRSITVKLSENTGKTNARSGISERAFLID